MTYDVTRGHTNHGDFFVSFFLRVCEEPLLYEARCLIAYAAYNYQLLGDVGG